eukprot:337062_1
MLFYTALVCLFTIKACCSWTTGGAKYPEATQYITAGYDNNNDTILLFDRQRFVKFKDGQFTVVDDEYLPYTHRIMNSHHAYIQFDDVLWLLHYQGEKFVTINTHTYEYSTFSTGYRSFWFAFGACLASSPGFIIITGGQDVGTAIDGDTQFYDIATGNWSTGPQLLRRSGGCVVVNQKLYVIGGYDMSAYPKAATDSISMMDISALPSTTGLVWSTLSGTLSQARIQPALKTYGYAYPDYSTPRDVIFVAGGYAYPDYFSTVDIIDTLYGTCVLSAIDPMAFAQGYAASITVDNVWFVIGGSTRSYQLRAFGPTRAPTPKPTQSPTAAPTPSPTRPPTSETFTPSFSPTAAPSFMPSVSPSNAPTSPPTVNPTMAPSVPPSKAPSVPPTIAPSVPPTKDPTGTAVTGDDFTAMQDQLDTLAVTHQWVFSGFTAGIIAIALCAWIDAHCIRKNDYLQITFILGIALQTLDMFSDCFFAFNMGIWRSVSPIYVLILALSVTFIVSPCAFTMGQLIHHSRKHWIKSSDQVRTWLASRANVLYFASIITGSSFAAVSLCNSYLFQLGVFDMGLTRNEIHAFMYKRVYSVVLLENIPQLCLQCFFVYSSGALDDLITISSIIFSILSIIVSILSMATQRSISRGQGTVSIFMNVTGSVVTAKASSCKRVKRKLIKELSTLVGVSQNITEVVKPIHIKQGFQVTVQFNVADSEQDFHRTLVEAEASGELATIFKRAWDLSGDPMVSVVKQSVTQSKRERLDSESLSEGAGKPTMTSNELHSGAADIAVHANARKMKKVTTSEPWSCSVCTYSNSHSLNRCQMCNNPKN